MGKVQLFEIRLSDSRVVYSPGEPLVGSVTVRLAGALQYRGKPWVGKKGGGDALSLHLAQGGGWLPMAWRWRLGVWVSFLSSPTPLQDEEERTPPLLPNLWPRISAIEFFHL